ncbi:hypothetical protein [Desulfitobacterium sp.]|uniref:hypothetical protein n=1 Tax=Desulfitobacterium sp. TaxID=49981 RepID=UPI002CEB44FC|nr:hypothetical protein [Desulfitobacterium sp.]HVJ48607.1 hypothetical protein [Desulfitobacterium sp.]
MARIIAINRKYFTLTLSVLLICFLGIAGVTLWKTANASATKTDMVPEVKMLGLAVEPASFTRDLTYGSVTLKGSQVISSKNFDLIVTVQNTTGQKMSNIPIELEASLIGDDSKKVSKLGNLPSLDPGATARVAFRQVNALGDAQGKSATTGQHKITLRVKPNAAGGVNQATEATFYFNVDTTVKSPKVATPVPQNN